MLFALTLGDEQCGQQEGWGGRGSPGDGRHSPLGPAACLNKYTFTQQLHTCLTSHTVILARVGGVTGQEEESVSVCGVVTACGFVR